VIVRNSGHVTAIDDADGCASVIVRAFVAGAPVDASCAARIPPVRLVPVFALRVTDVPAATPARSGTRNDRDLRAAATALYAAADALYRVRSYDIRSGKGLRGGSFVALDRGTKITLTLRHVRWTNDLATSGTVTYDVRSARVQAALRFSRSSAVRATWYTRGAASSARMTGTVYGEMLDAAMPAP